MQNKKQTLNRFIYNRYIYTYKRSALGRFLKNRRFTIVDSALHGKLSDITELQKVLEIGVGNGVDFIRIAAKNPSLELYGIDIVRPPEIQQFEFIEGDAEKIEFPDRYFDVTVSFGVLEHIQPIEKLSRVIKELVRVSKSYCIEVPAVSTLFEPHMASFLWQLRDRNKKQKHPVGWLNYFSDEAWLQFEGFSGASTKRFTYMPFVTQLLIFRNHSEH